MNSSNTKLDISKLQYIKGIGPKKAEAFVKDGIHSPRDLVNYFPRTYIDRSSVGSLKALELRIRQESSSFGESFNFAYSTQTEVIVVVFISSVEEKEFSKKRKMLRLKLSDGSGGKAEIVFWSYVDFFKKLYKPGKHITVSGKPEINRYGAITFHHPEIEKFDPDDKELYSQGKILPIYKLTENMRKAKIGNRQLREIISNVLPNEIDKVRETLPDTLLEKYKLPDKKMAVWNLHFPDDSKLMERSKIRMKFEEIFFFELFLALVQKDFKETEKSPIFNPKSTLARNLYDNLPFSLTKAQTRVIREIASDMESGKPMNRLLQGDVGSGKTIVALLSMLIAIDNGCQVALMAPTEILAEQHFHSISKYLEDLNIGVVQLLGGQRKKIREEVKDKIITQEAKVIVGTHAMFQSDVEYNKLGLIVIDEQHRFGVAQRGELRDLGKQSFGNEYVPHVLVMSATPIPRTITLTAYGDLDISIIDELPRNRKPIKTKIVYESQLHEVYNFITDQVDAGKQAYIVFPLVEKSEKMDLKSAVEHYEKLSTEVFYGYKCGLLHGQMLWYEKEDTMRDFLNKEYQILIATTVIEVGIDIPNATVMLIQNAERFGLSQLHQLRGRVGRGVDQSFCLLATKDHFKFQIRKKENQNEDRQSAIVRLKTMEETTDGFRISEVDLNLRGPGDILGTRQSGLPDFKFVELAKDGVIIKHARKEAFSIFEHDPKLKKPENSHLKEVLTENYAQSIKYFDIA